MPAAAAAAAAADLWAALLSSGLDATAPVLWVLEGFIGAALVPVYWVWFQSPGVQRN
jgi:hypothetical protein